ATIARIVADDPPPMRSVRPELPPGLDRVVLRGLERDRGRRWRDLEEFRTALLPYVSANLSMGGLGLRVAAFLIDCFVFFPVLLLDIAGVVPLISGGHDLAAYFVLVALPWLVYLTILEGLYGLTVGKWCFRLRVYAGGAGYLP